MTMRYVDTWRFGDRELVDRRKQLEERRGADRREPGPGKGRDKRRAKPHKPVYFQGGTSLDG